MYFNIFFQNRKITFSNSFPIYRSAENEKRGWSSATNLTKDDFRGSSESSSYAATGWTSLMDLSAIDNEEERLEGKVHYEKKECHFPLWSSINVYFSFVVEFIPLLADRRPTKLQIKEVIDNSNESASENDVEFIIQVKEKRKKKKKKKPKIVVRYENFNCCLSQCCNSYFITEIFVNICIYEFTSNWMSMFKHLY